MLQPVLRKKNRILKVDQKGKQFILQMEAGWLRIWPQTSGIVRVSFSETEHFSEKQGAEYGISSEDVDASLQVTEKNILIQTEKLLVQVDSEKGSLTYLRPDGTLLLKEKETESRELIPFKVFKTIVDENTKIENIETADGVKQKITEAVKVFDRTLFHTRLNLSFTEKEALYGLGQMGDGRLNLSHSTQYLNQANLKIAIPMLVSSKGYGIFLSTQGPAVFHDTEDGTYLYTEADEMLDYYFIDGETLDGVVKGFRQLTGKAVLLPKWAYGYIQSQERYETEEEILRVAKEFRKEKFGLDGIVLDWMSWNDGMWGSKVRDDKRFPNPSEMMKTLHEGHVHFMLSIWPNMTEESSDYREMKAADGILPGTTLYNAFSPEARKIYWKQAYSGWYQYGTDAWWCDSSEAITPEWNIIHRPQDFNQYTDFVNEAAKIMPIEKANAYGLYHAQGIYEGQRSVNDGKRVLNLTRSGYPGSQKYGTVQWSGDTSASYAELERQIAKGLNFSASGMPYWTFDIGAFFIKQGEQWYWNGEYDKAEEDAGYRELYTRWFQFGAFLPMFRSHGTDCRREPWTFRRPGEPFYEALLSANRMRYRLMPYIYSLAAGVTLDDKAILRLLAFDFPEDETVLEIKNQYLFGPSLMVCPVTEPMLFDVNSKPIKDARKTKTVYLPKGCDWYDFYTGERYTGGQYIEAALCIEHIPVYVKAGTVLPMAEGVYESTEEMEGADITAFIYPGADGSFTLYEDAGDGYGYEQGEYCKTEITYKDSTGAVEMTTTGDERFRKGKLNWKYIG